LAFAGIGGDVDSTCGVCRAPRTGRSGTRGCDFSGDSDNFDFAGRAGIWGFVEKVMFVVDRSSCGLNMSVSGWGIATVV